MKKTLLFSLSMLMTIASFSQFPYTFSVSTASYQPLTLGGSVNNAAVWDDEDFEIPLGFTFKMDSMSVDTFHFTSGTMFGTASQVLDNIFLVTDLDLYDRGNAGGSFSRSPIRYEISGSTGNRIFKIEVANAGIYDEYDLYGTDNDSVYYQVWLYEGTNVVEVRFGPSHITPSNYSDYYYMTGKPIHGYAKNMDYFTGSFTNFYFLKGNSASPAIDSVSNWMSFSGGLNTHPANGTVYKYTPKPKSVSVNDALAAQNIQLVNNISSTQLLINNSSSANYTYKVVSVNGATMNVTGNLSGGKQAIDISSLPAGMYLLHVVGSADAGTFKFNKI